MEPQNNNEENTMGHNMQETPQEQPRTEEQPSSSPAMEQQPPSTPVSAGVADTGMPKEEEKMSYGPIIGIVVIVILLILAGFYFWGESLQEKYNNNNPVMEGEMMEGDGAMMEETRPAGAPDAGTFDDTSGEADVPVSESDDLETIEAELDSTELDSLDAELSDIDAELNAE